MRSAARRLSILILPLLACACILLRNPTAMELSAPVTTSSAVKAHLVDGSVVVFPAGARYAGDSIVGIEAGRHYDLSRSLVGPRAGIALDSVVGVEAVEAGPNVPASVLASALAAGGAFVAGSLAYVAIFGSCPTVYASTDAGARMEAELFSHSIVPLAEARDVDRLGVASSANPVTLDIRNEALETHFINHVELLEIAHEEGEWVTADPSGLPIAVSGWMPTVSVRDREGRDVTAMVSATDSLHFGTSGERLQAATEDDLEDHLVVEVPAPTTDSAAVVLRLRNSLLNSVLLYDFMLGGAGLQAADWLGGTLSRLGSAVEVGAWYRSRMGLHAEVWEDGAFRPVKRLGDSGPLAWKEVALTVPVPSGEDRLRIRLSFVTDHWRIDRVRVAEAFRRPEMRVVPLDRILDREGEPLPEAYLAAASPDERYLETLPGDVVQAVFEVGPATGERTFLLASQGYYTEWLRPDWIRKAVPPRPFVPSDSVLMLAVERWREVKTEMEQAFFVARVPTR